MKHVSIVVLEDVVLSNIASAYSLFVTANEISKQTGDNKPFEIDLIGVQLRNVQLNLPVQFYCTKTIHDDFNTDLIVLPGISDLANPIANVIRKNRVLIDWLKIKWSEGKEIMSLCTGAYLLAEAGILDGREAATHWQAADELQMKYPRVNFRSDKVTIDYKGIITGGGANSSLNTVLYAIEKVCGKSVAIHISKIYGIDYGRNHQNVFAIFSGNHNHNDHNIHDAQTFIEEKFDRDISVEKVADAVSMSKRNFIRRFKLATGLNPIEYIQRTKVEAAKKLLEQGHPSISTLHETVGYNDTKAFRSVFKKLTGYSPLEYRAIYNFDLPTPDAFNIRMNGVQRST